MKEANHEISHNMQLHLHKMPRTVKSGEVGSRSAIATAAAQCQKPVCLSGNMVCFEIKKQSRKSESRKYHWILQFKLGSAYGSTFHLIIETKSLTEPSPSWLMECQEVPGLTFSCFPCHTVLGLKTHLTKPGHRVEAGDLNPALCACATSSLPVEPSP